tara:strand:- start:12392 stop:13957 length:1566 start_codon:yes stop_codon:yes gene_type:complete
MAAIITDQIRILNAKNFVSGVSSSVNSYYAFVGLPNPTSISDDWNDSPPSPTDNLNRHNAYWDTIIGLKKITGSDVKQVVRKVTWTSGSTFDYYRPDYSISNVPKNSNGVSLYSANYYVINSDYRVYICLQNGTTPETPDGKPSLDEPTFTDLEPRSAGTSGDGYIWKYLYTIKPADLIKFDSTDYMPVPKDWESNNDNAGVRDNAIDGSIKVVVIKNRGTGIGTANRTYTRVPIKGDGSGAECTVVINSDSAIESVTLSNEGSGYTYGNVDLTAGSVPTPDTWPTLDVIIPPQGGHGKDIYRELGATNALMYARIENDAENPDFITGNEIARIGIIENPKAYDSSSILTIDKASAAYAMRLVGTGYSSATFTPDSIITQTVGSGVTAIGKVINYDTTTGVLKYWQDRTMAGFTTTTSTVTGVAVTNPQYGYEITRFSAAISEGGTFGIVGTTSGLTISTDFSGLSTSINNKTYYLGQSFTKGLSNPEVKKYSGNIIYLDNRPAIKRSSNQKEDIKVILQF